LVPGGVQEGRDPELPNEIDPGDAERVGGVAPLRDERLNVGQPAGVEREVIGHVALQPLRRIRSQRDRPDQIRDGAHRVRMEAGLRRVEE
jgi:hypothetical protein